MRLDGFTADRCKDRPRVQEYLFRGLCDDWLLNTEDEPLTWLDVCCGRGAAMQHLAELFGEHTPRIRLSGFDVMKPFLTEAVAVSKNVGVDFRAHCGELRHLLDYYRDQRFLAVTLINVLHELRLAEVPELILDMTLLAEKANGFVYLFDISALPYGAPEPGSIPWLGTDVKKVLEVLRTELGLRQRISTGWDVRRNLSPWWARLPRRHIPDEGEERLQNPEERQRIAQLLAERTYDVFQARLTEIDRQIRTAAERTDGAQQPGDPADPEAGLAAIRAAIDVQLRDFWACYRELHDLGERLGRSPASVGGT